HLVAADLAQIDLDRAGDLPGRDLDSDETRWGCSPQTHPEFAALRPAGRDWAEIPLDARDLDGLALRDWVDGEGPIRSGRRDPLVVQRNRDWRLCEDVAAGDRLEQRSPRHVDWKELEPRLLFLTGHDPQPAPVA